MDQKYNSSGRKITMPEDSKPLVVISVDDIYLYAKNEGLERFKVTKKEARIIFDSIDRLNWDSEYSTFWSFVESAITDFKKGILRGKKI